LLLEYKEQFFRRDDRNYRRSAHTQKMENYAEDAFESRSAPKNLRCLRTAIHMAQEVGEALGAGKDLFGSL
jgi:hypothetical protein